MPNDYAALKVQLTLLRERMKAEGRQAFTEMSREFFERNPNVESFGWKQYTPYFNDGDTCYFGVCSDADSVEVNGVQGYDVPVERSYKYNDKANNLSYYEERDQKLKVHKEVEEFLKAFEKEDLETFFGDHMKVTVYRDGTVETTEYDHD